MVEFDWSPAFQSGLLSSTAVDARRTCLRRWCLRVAWRLPGDRRSVAGHLVGTSLVTWPLSIERCAETLRLAKDRRAVLNRRAEGGFRTFNAMLRQLRLLRLGPAPSGVVARAKQWLGAAGLGVGPIGLSDSACDGLNCGSHRSCDSDRIRVTTSSALDSVAGRQERVEALDEVGMPREEL